MNHSRAPYKRMLQCDIISYITELTNGAASSCLFVVDNISRKEMKGLFVFGLIASLCLLGVSGNEETPAAEAAPASETPSTAEIKAKICEPGTLNEVACNTCICNKDGTELACTKKICVDMKEDTVVPQNLPVADVLESAKPSDAPETKERRRRRRGY